MNIAIVRILGLVSLGMILSCANIVMPSGGAKDNIPPKVVKTFPENNSINFHGNEIVFCFDEFVELETPQKNIFLSPYISTNLEYYLQGKKLHIQFPDGLKQNTTYSIQLSAAIKDFREGNIMSNYELKFSTGNYLDSGKLIVEAKDVKTNTGNSLTLACLVKNKMDFFGKNYSYISKMNSDIASFTNLNNGEYYLYTFVDSNQNMKWEKTEPIGFVNEKIRANTETKKIKLFTQAQTKTNFSVLPKTANEFDILSSQEVLTVKLSDTNYIWLPINTKSFKVIAKTSFEPKTLRLNYNGDKYENLELPKNIGAKNLERIPMENRLDNMVRNDTVELLFNSYITKLTLDNIKLKIDNKEEKTNLLVDKNKLILTDLDFGKNYTLTVDSQAIWYLGTYNKPFVYSFSTYPKEKYYSELFIKLDPSLLLLQNVKIYLSQQNQLLPFKTHNLIKLQNVYGEEVKFHILIDRNNNGYWDSGDVEKEIQPEDYYIETIRLEPNKKEYQLKIKSL